MDVDPSGPPGLSTQPNSPTTMHRQRTHSQSHLGQKSNDSIEIKKEEVATRLGDRDNNWDRRPNSLEDMKYNDQGRKGGRPDTRYIDNNRDRLYDRDRDAHRDRDREREANWDRDRDHNRDRGGPIGRMNSRDLDRDRRNDDRDRFDNRRPTGEPRHYEPLRRHDSRTSVTGPPESPTTAARSDENRDRDRPGPPGDARVPRPLGEERSLGSFRPPDDRDRRPPPLHDDRRPPPDDRRPVPGDRRGPPPSLERERDRPGRPVDDRQPPSISDRRPLPPDERRRSPGPGNNGYNADRQARPHLPDDPRPLRAGSPSADRSRPVGPPSTSRGPPPIIEDRRPQPPISNTHVASDRGRPPADERAVPRPATSAPIPPSDDRPSLADRSIDRTTRTHVPLEDRISRPPPTLQERLSGGSEQPPAARQEVRPSAIEPRPPAAQPALRAADVRPPPSNEPPTESSRPTTSGSGPGTEERGRPADRFPRPPPPVQADRDRIRSGPAPPYVGSRAPSVAREDNRAFKRVPSVSPSRRYVAPRSGFTNRPPPAEYDRDRRPDNAIMDVDPPPSRYDGAERPPPSVYRRSPPATYTDRNWPPSGPDSYPADARRPPPPSADSHAPYSREWREDERGYPPGDYDRRAWDRDRERDRDYERETRIPERDPLPPPSSGPTSTWERDRRAYPPPPVDTAAPPARPFDQRPLSARLTDGYPPADDRDRDIDRDRPPYSRDYDRARYPPGGVEPPAAYNRVRPRSPSPAGSTRAPPVKRIREEGYPGYYSPTHSNAMDVTPDYPPHPRTRTSPPPASYYDDPRGPGYNVGPTSSGVPPPRDREYPDARDVYTYDRRGVDTRGPPPSRRTPPPYARPYERDDRRYPPRP